MRKVQFLILLVVCSAAWAQSEKPCGYKLEGDLNSDCVVNLEDVAILAINWLVDCNRDPDNPSCFAVPAISQGDLIITEIMQNPSAASDGFGEYFEIYNTTEEVIDLQDLTIRSSSDAPFDINVSLLIKPHGHLVLGRNMDRALNGGVFVDFVYSGITLGNSADDIAISNGNFVIDEVAWDGGATFPDPTGASMNLSVDHYDSIDNDDGLNWCTTPFDASLQLSGGDYGTPGAFGVECGIGIESLAAGDLIITEIMQNPSAVSDGVGEFFEIYNATGQFVDVYGLEISSSSDEPFIIDVPLLLPPGRYLVLGKSADQVVNGGISVDFAYSDMNFSNGADDIAISNSSIVIDEVAWDGGASFPDPTGASMNLSLEHYDSIDNDDGSNWCESPEGESFRLPGGDYGSPGKENATCALPK